MAKSRALLLVLTTPSLLGVAAAQSALVLDGGQLVAVSSNGAFVGGMSGSLNQEVLYSLSGGERPLPGTGPIYAVSDDGTVAITGGELWTEAGGLVPVPGPSGSRPVDLSADGSIVLIGGGTAPVSTIWDRTSGATQPLDTPAGSISAVAEGLSSDGSVAFGSATYPPNVSVAVVWSTSSGAVTVIGPQSGPASTTARASSADGTWITGPYVVPGQPVRAFRWSAATGLVLVPPGGQPDGANGWGAWISSDGTRVVTVETTGGFVGVSTWLWEQGQTTRPLRAWLQSKGAQLAPGDIYFASASDDLETLSCSILDGPFSVSSTPTIWLDAAVSSPFCGPAVTNSLGVAAEVELLGSDLAGGATLVLAARGLVPAEAVLPITARQAAFLPGAGGSVGTLCLGGAIGRFGVGAADAAGRYEVSVDSDALPRPNGSAVAMAGETWRFQVWYRDPQGGGSNFTGGAELLFR